MIRDGIPCVVNANELQRMLFHRLVGAGKQRLRDSNPQRLGCLQVNDQLSRKIGLSLCRQRSLRAYGMDLALRLISELPGDIIDHRANFVNCAAKFLSGNIELFRPRSWLTSIRLRSAARFLGSSLIQVSVSHAAPFG